MSDEQRLQDELTKKIRLERSISPDVRRMFKRQAGDFLSFVSAYGYSPGSADYTDDIQAILLQHYRKVQRAFIGDTTFTATKEDGGISDEISAIVMLELSLWAKETAAIQADIISNTTEQQMNDAISRARMDLSESGEEQSNANIAALAAVYLRRALLARVEAISTLATQMSAETTKFTEATVSSGGRVRPSSRFIPSLSFLKPTKTWKTVGDTRVRLAHSAANGQTVSINEWFIVSGERLKYPGDTSGGASIKNVANCRCSARYSIQ